MVMVDSDADGTMDTAIADLDGDGTFEVGIDKSGSFDPSAAESETDVEVVDPFSPVDTIDPADSGSDSVHGDPMAEIPYHQAQVGPNDCLPTSVAMVLTEITGEEVPQGDLVDLANELDLLGPTGMSVEGGVQLLEHYGVDAEVQTGSVDDLRAMLDAGKPVIIGLDSDDLYGTGDQPFTDDLVAGHAVVITGIDDEAGLVYINDPGFPDGAGVAIPLADFEDAWVDADHTMIVADDPKTEDEDLAGIPNPDRKGRIYDLILLPFTLVLR
jgi:hypothetical protein